MPSGTSASRRLAESLVRAGDRGQPAARGLRSPAQAELHHAGKSPAAELRAVLLARGRDPAILPALPHQLLAWGFRPAGHADTNCTTRKGQSVRPQAQAAIVSERPADGLTETPPTRGAAVIFIFVTILLDTLALGVIIPMLPKLIESFVDNDTANAARIFGLFGTVWALMQFFFSPILGGLSDRFGRRPVVLLSNFGLAADYVLMALAPSLAWLFVGRVISGITSASISTAFAYITDVTAPEQRAAVFGKIGVAFGAGFILGPALGGMLGGIDPRLPFWVAAGLSFANGLYGLLVLPDRCRQSAVRRSAGRAPIRSAQCTCCVRTAFWQACRWRISLRNWRMWCCPRPTCSMPPIAMAGTRGPSA